MNSPTSFYRDLISPVPATPVTQVTQGLHWTRVGTADGMGLALTMSESTRPELSESAYHVGEPLNQVAELALSWNFREAAIGAAAINTHYSTPAVAESAGVTAQAGLHYPHVFQALSSVVEGKKVAVIGHFPFAPPALEKAADFAMLEINAQSGDYPPSAAEFLLPEADFVFISGSALVNKTLPRLLELSQDAYTIVVGPSTPLSPTLFDAGADYLSSLVTIDVAGMDKALGSIRFPAMMDNGYRADLAAPGRDHSAVEEAMAAFRPEETQTQ